MILHEKDKDDKMLLAECVEVRINQSLLMRNFSYIDSALKQLKESTASFSDLQKEVLTLRQKVGKQEKEIHELVLQNESRSQFSLSEIVDRLSNCQSKQEALSMRLADNQKHTRNLFDIAKYLDYDELAKNLQKKNKFVARVDFEPVRDQLRLEIARLFKQKANLSQLEQLKHNAVVKQQYKVFQFETKRELSRLQSEKQNCAIVKAVEQRLGAAAEGLKSQGRKHQQLAEKVTDFQRYLNQMNLGQIEMKFKRAKKQLKDSEQMVRSLIYGKANSSDFELFQKKLWQKLDFYMLNKLQGFSDKNETRKALLYLEKRMNMLLGVVEKGEKKQGEEPNEAMLATSRPWKCASCANNLARYEGKVVRSKPHQHKVSLTPQKTGYNTFLQKLAIKKLAQPFSNSEEKGQKLELLAQAIMNIQGSKQDKRLKPMNHMAQFGQSSSRLQKVSEFEVREEKEEEEEPELKQEFQRYMERAEQKVRALRVGSAKRRRDQPT